MNGGKRPLGYTILEVMIVLAISGMMFLIATTFINGKQQNTAFTAGVNEMASRLQDVLDQVQSGKYSDVPLTCSASGGSVDPQPGTSSNSQGTNAQCVFLGKVVHFSVNGVASNYDIVSLAGDRTASQGSGSNASAAGAKVINSLTTSSIIPQSLNVTKISSQFDVKSSLNSFAIGFLQTQGSNTDPANGPIKLETGAQSLELYYVSGVAANTSTGTFSSTLTGNLTPAPNDYAGICIEDGTRYARITIGSHSNQLDISVKMDGRTISTECSV